MRRPHRRGVQPGRRGDDRAYGAGDLGADDALGRRELKQQLVELDEHRDQLELDGRERGAIVSMKCGKAATSLSWCGFMWPSREMMKRKSIFPWHPGGFASKSATGPMSQRGPVEPERAPSRTSTSISSSPTPIRTGTRPTARTTAQGSALPTPTTPATTSRPTATRPWARVSS